MAYYAVEPWGEAQAEYRAGLIASTMANTARDEKKRPSPFEASEFMRSTYLETVDKPDKQDEGEGLLAKAKMIFGMIGRK